MDEPIDERYFKWLYRQVGSTRLKDSTRTYWSLARQLFTKEFVWIVPNDDNRIEDGRDLRHEFVNAFDIWDVDPEWLGLGCSMLEMMLGLSRRLTFEAEGESRDWFWFLAKNLELTEYNDKYYQHESYLEEVDDVLDVVIWRTYAKDGRGGLFPLENPHQDQRKIEIWYQLNAFLEDQD